MPVIKDLVVDMSSFWNHLEAVEPTLVLVRDKSEREFYKHLKSEHSLIRLAIVLCVALLLSAMPVKLTQILLVPTHLLRLTGWWQTRVTPKQRIV